MHAPARPVGSGHESPGPISSQSMSDELVKMDHSIYQTVLKIERTYYDIEGEEKALSVNNCARARIRCVAKTLRAASRAAQPLSPDTSPASSGMRPSSLTAGPSRSLPASSRRCAHPATFRTHRFAHGSAARFAARHEARRGASHFHRRILRDQAAAPAAPAEKGVRSGLRPASLPAPPNPLAARAAISSSRPFARSLPMRW